MCVLHWPLVVPVAHEHTVKNPEDNKSYYYVSKGKGRVRLLPDFDRKQFDATRISCLVFEHLESREERDIFEVRVLCLSWLLQL